MSRQMRTYLLLLSILVFPMTAVADDLTGQQHFLCSPVLVNVCSDDGKCESATPWDLNIPQFLEFNLKDKLISTTKASNENRSTPIRNLLNENGHIYLQGVEAGRAFSFVIEEKTGLATIAVARDDKTVSVFGACTPIVSGAK
jgi:hypothetical protein